MKSVLIVGAGPAGLVTAKTLLHSFPRDTFCVKILDRNARVGGMWAVEHGEHDGRISPDMRVNGSRFTVHFSDFSYASANVGEDPLPMFPRAWQVGRYLRAYADKYIPADAFQLQVRVTSAERVNYQGRDVWKVEWNGPPEPGYPPPKKRKFSKSKSPTPDEINYLLKSSGSTYQGFFDFLVVATGFFHASRSLRLQPRAGSPPFHAKQQHSSEFRSVDDLLGARYKDEDGAIVVVGGGMSGVEAASTAALQISDGQHSPSAPTAPANRKVYHVTMRPFYVLPRYVPPRPPEQNTFDPAPLFAPLDLRMYDLSRWPKGPIFPMNGRVPPGRAALGHQYLQSVLGDNQDDLGSSVLTQAGRDMEKPAFVGISDNYAEFVRQGIIIPIRGKATALEVNPASGCVVNVLSGTKTERIKNVLGIVHGTGFTPRDSVNWLAKEVRQAMECEETCHRMPLLMNRHCICHDNYPSLGFVGFYEGPWWGVMEMQARLIAQRWSTIDDNRRVGPGPSSHQADLLKADPHSRSKLEIAEMRELRNAVMQKLPDVPQFWMGDYVGLMEGFARELGIQRDDEGFLGEHSGPCIPGRYPDLAANRKEARRNMGDLHSTLNALTNGTLFVAPAAFRALQGQWKLQRTLTSELPGLPACAFKGTAHFHARFPTHRDFEGEYLYVESLELEVKDCDGGKKRVPASRSYVYRYSMLLDQLSVWFVQADGKSADRLFYEMRFAPRTDEMEERGDGWIARGHGCGDVEYETTCEFRFKGVSLETFGLRYDVRGPEKDYSSENQYARG